MLEEYQRSYLIVRVPAYRTLFKILTLSQSVVISRIFLVSVQSLDPKDSNKGDLVDNSSHAKNNKMLHTGNLVGNSFQQRQQIFIHTTKRCNASRRSVNRLLRGVSGMTFHPFPFD